MIQVCLHIHSKFSLSTPIWDILLIYDINQTSENNGDVIQTSRNFGDVFHTSLWSKSNSSEFWWSISDYVKRWSFSNSIGDVFQDPLLKYSYLHKSITELQIQELVKYRTWAKIKKQHLILTRINKTFGLGVFSLNIKVRPNFMASFPRYSLFRPPRQITVTVLKSFILVS